MRILCVDDNTALLEMLSAIIAQLSDYELATANSGAAAISELKSNQFDVLLTDCEMPGMSGFNLADRAGELNPHLPVIFMSGSPEKFHRSDRFISKPFSLSTLRSAIRDATSSATATG